MEPGATICTRAAPNDAPPETVGARATTDARSFDLDTLQDQLDDGPCVECLRDGERHDLDPVTSDERWPRFGPSSRRVGLIACVALPLVAHDELIGVLNLYAWPAIGFAGWIAARGVTHRRGKRICGSRWGGMGR